MDVQTITIVSTVVTTFATLLYVSLTYISHREQRREKEKPRIQEIAEVIIYPTIGKIESQKAEFKKGDFLWSQNAFHYYQQKVVPTTGIEKLIYEGFGKSGTKSTQKLEEYDKALEWQKGILDNFANAIRLLPDFKDKVFELFENFEINKHSDYFEPNAQNVEFILEHIVNNRQNLASSDAYHNFWNQFGGDLLKFRDREEVKTYKLEVENGCNNLVELGNSILKDLKSILSKYRKKYGITYKELDNW